MVLKSIFDEELMELLGFEKGKKCHGGAEAAATGGAAGAGVHSKIL